jgi:hypothetical protein
VSLRFVLLGTALAFLTGALFWAVLMREQAQGKLWIELGSTLPRDVG